jgi:hypothetical protein
MTLQGKGFFIRDLSACEAGNPAAIQAAARLAGLSHVIVRIADGLEAVGIDADGVDALASVVQTLHAAGIAVWGWGTAYGEDPQREAVVAVARLQDLGLDGFVVRAGGGFEKPGRESSAWCFLDALRREVDLPVALSSYRFPIFHPRFPWAAFLELCDLYMPQVFWELAHDAGAQLRESKRQCDVLPNAKPFIPTGAAYGPLGAWAPDQADLADFLGAVRELELPAVNFYAWESCRANLPALWESIAAFRWENIREKKGASGKKAASWKSAAARTSSRSAVPAGGSLPAALQPLAPSEPDAFAIKFLTALNSRRPDRVAALYAVEATRVRADRILEGTAAIQADYRAFFASLPEDADIALLRVGIQGVVRYLTWQAGPVNGLTTLVVQDGRIVQDYTLLE